MAWFSTWFSIEIDFTEADLMADLQFGRR